MRVAVQLSPIGTSPATIAETAAAFERARFESVWVGDHPVDYHGTSGRSAECFTALAAIATRTERIGLGSLVASCMFRPPRLLAQIAGSLADLSGGRFELGIGTGGVKLEHRALDVLFPSAPERVERLSTALETLTSMRRNEPVDVEISRRTQHVESMSIAHPALGGVRLVVAALGPVVGRLAGRFADEVNVCDYAEGFDVAAVIRTARRTAAQSGRDISTSVLVPDTETDTGGGRHPDAGVERARALGAERIIFRILPPYPAPDELVESWSLGPLLEAPDDRWRPAAPTGRPSPDREVDAASDPR